MLIDEIKKDPMIAAEVLAWVRDKQGRIRPFIPNVVQRKYYSDKISAIAQGKKPLFLNLKSRRMGVTTWEQWDSLHLSLFKPNQSVVTVAHEQQSTELIFDIAKLMYSKLHPSFRTGETKANKREFTFANKSKFYIGTAGASTFGRGQTLQKFHGSEVAFWPGTINDIDNLILGLTEACSHGSGVLETTAKGRDNWFYHIWCDAEKGNNNWIPLFYPWFLDPTYYINPTLIINGQSFYDIPLDEEEIMLRAKYSLSDGQLFWRRDKIRTLNNSIHKFNQEYPHCPEVAFLVSGHTFFDINHLNKIGLMTKNPIPRNIIEANDLYYREGETEYWALPIKGEEYVAATDTAGGSINEESDYCITTISLKRTKEQVARLRTKMIPAAFARFNCNIWLPQFNNPLWAIEINNHGHSVMNTVLNECNYSNIYRMQDYQTTKFRGYGWQTNSKTRSILLNDYQAYLSQIYSENLSGIINDKILINEAMDFVDNEGKYEASEGKHDDTLLAWMLNYQATKQTTPSITILD